MLTDRLLPLTLALVSGATLLTACGGGDESTSGTGGGATTGTMSSTTGSGGSGGSGGAGGSGGSGGAGGSGGGAGGASACDMLAPGPFKPTIVHSVLKGSEDIAFDGKGHIVGKKGNEVVLVDANGQTSLLATGVATAYGLRYRPDGVLVVALPNAGKVVQISPQGEVVDYATGLSGANGVYADFDGNVWVTNFAKVVRINADASVDTIVSGAAASAVNGVVVDAARSKLFYTDYGAGLIRRIDLPAGASPQPTQIAQIGGAKLDGLVMDGCGHIYAVDQGGSKLYRVRLDAAGDAVGDAELLAEFDANVANAQFGAGPGYDPTTLYVAGNPGIVYAVPVGVPGAPVPLPP